jgi:uncharacterized protein DUF4011
MPRDTVISILKDWIERLDLLPPTTSEETLTGTLEIARRDLLDLGLRNNLLNYRSLRAKGVEVIDEMPAEIFRLLVKEALHFSRTKQKDWSLRELSVMIS